jgi:hypothetical protein
MMSAEDEAAWNAYVDAHRLGTWWHRTEWLRYQLAYASGCENRSHLARDPTDGRAIGLTPLIVLDGTAEMGGDCGPLPLADEGCAGTMLQLIAGGRPAERIRVRSSWRDGIDAMKAPGAEWHLTRMLDVSRPYCDLWAGMRKSYQSLVNQARATYDIWCGTDAELMACYEAVKLETGTRRPAATYAEQAKWLTQGNGLVAVAYTKDTRRPVSAAYAIIYRDWAYYASGASAVKSIQHALQWAIIEELAARNNVRWYELGWQGLAKDKKGRNIEFFKRGFGGQDVPWWTWEGRIDDIGQLAGACV